MKPAMNGAGPAPPRKLFMSLRDVSFWIGSAKGGFTVEEAVPRARWAGSIRPTLSLAAGSMVDHGGLLPVSIAEVSAGSRRYPKPGLSEVA